MSEHPDDPSNSAMRWSRGPNLFASSEPPVSGERFDVLANLDRVHIERIVSSTTPGSELYDQIQDEWVVLLHGSAVLEVAGERVELAAGDTLLLPRRTPHRVLATSEGALWLAVHVSDRPR